jgi:putative ABC transport system permease protein
MSWIEAIRTALAMIRAHKLRAFFTVLGTVVGVTFLIAVITLITGMNDYMEKDFAGRVYGFNTVQLRHRPSVVMNPTEEQWREWRRRPRLTFEDADWLAERIETPGVVAISSDRTGRVQSPRGMALDNIRIVGASATYFAIRDLDLVDGRPFSEQEAQRGLPVVVLGHEVADKLFEGRSAVGQTVRIQNFPYQVIGTMERQGSLFGMSLDNVAVAPARSPVNGFVNAHNVVDEIAFKVPDTRYLAAAMTEIEGLMRIRHRLRPEQPNSFQLETAEEGLSFWENISRILMVALPGLVGVSLLVGGVVIMNIMLVSVTDRTREIGLRKSLGARRNDILKQFLIEAGTLSGAGGLLGIGAGVLLAIAVSAMSPLPAQVALWSVGLAILLGVGVGLAAGVYPAYRASRLDPIEALRQE